MRPDIVQSMCEAMAEAIHGEVNVWRKLPEAERVTYIKGMKEALLVLQIEYAGKMHELSRRRKWKPT